MLQHRFIVMHARTIRLLGCSHASFYARRPTSVSTPTPTSAAPSNGGTGCIAQDQKVFEENRGEINVSDLEIGNRVMTYQGFQDFIGYIHNGSFQYTFKITIDTKSTVELTKNHLVKVKNNYVHAKYVKIGDQFSSGKVTKITNGMSFVVSPLTRSGTIIVNNVVLCKCLFSPYCKLCTCPSESEPD